MNEMDQSQIQLRLDALKIVNEVFETAVEYLKRAHAQEEESEPELEGSDSHAAEEIEVDSEAEEEVEIKVDSDAEEEAIIINSNKMDTESGEPRLAVGETITVPIRITGPRNGRRVSFSDEIITVKAFGNNNNNNIFKKPKILKKQLSSNSLPVPTLPAPVQAAVMKKSILAKEPSVEIIEITRL